MTTLNNAKLPCLASKWADEWSDEQERIEAEFEEAEDYLSSNTDVMDDYALDLAESERIDTEDMEQAEWNQWIADRWEDIVELYLEKTRC